DLERAVVALRRLLQRVEVGGEGGVGPLLVASRPGDEAPGTGSDLDVEVGQEAGRAPDRVGADAPGRELGQERQGEPGQLGEHDAGRLQAIDPRERAETGGGARGPDVRHGPEPYRPSPSFLSVPVGTLGQWL